MAKAALLQTKSGVSAAYEVICNEERKYQIVVPFNYPGFHADICEGKTLLYSINWELSENLHGITKNELAVYNICDSSGGVSGSLVRKRNKTFGGYYYFSLELNGAEYVMYEVGLGKKGIKLPVFHESVQIALVEKDITVYNNHDTYQITWFSDHSLLASTLLTLYYDNLRFGNHGEFTFNSKKSFYLRSTNRELKQKYDPNWPSK